MALLPSLDFNAYCDRMRADSQGARTPSPGDLDYSYVLDRQTRTAFESAKPVELAVASAVRLFQERERGRLLGNAVKVSARQFPRIHGIALECAQTLGIAAPQVYVVNSPHVNAATYGTRTDSFVLVHSALIDQYTEQELRFVIGHECGHIHNSHVVYLTTLHLLKGIAQAALGPLAAPAVLPLSAWSRRAEITCDRAGLLCTQDDKIAYRALARLVVGSSKLWEQFNIDAFVEQYEEGRESLSRYMEAFASHPYLPKRIMALRVFAQSELFAAHVAQRDREPQCASGHVESERLSMPEVDRRVGALLKGHI